MRALLIRTNGSLEIIEEDGQAFAIARARIGAHLIEPVALDESGLELLCDEEGLLVDAAVNLVATWLATAALGRSQLIVGDTLLAHYDAASDVYGDLSDEMIRAAGLGNALPAA